MARSGWGLLGAIVLALVWTTVLHHRLRMRHNRVENAYAQIDVQLQRRYDLIPNLVDVAHIYMPHEAATLEAVLRAHTHAIGAADTARRHPGQPGAMGALAMAEQALGSQMAQFRRLAEACPVLLANARMQALQEAIASTENRIALARQAYNDQVQAYNDQAARFPDLLIARLMGFARLDMLAAAQNPHERSVPTLRF